jgi:hypothetical protein
MKKGNNTMDAFETARQSFFSGTVAPNTSTTFTQTKSFEGMPVEPANKNRVSVLHEENGVAAR